MTGYLVALTLALLGLGFLAASRLAKAAGRLTEPEATS